MKPIILRFLLALMAVAGFMGLLIAASCATTTLEACTLEISRSDPARDRLVCQGHAPIALRNVDPALRAAILGMQT